MNTMDIYALVWRINLHTPCYSKETMVRLTQLVSYIVAEVELHFTNDQAKKIFSDMTTSAFWHKGYYRKDKQRTPYIVHPFEVVELLFILGIFDYKLTVATIYHDNVEDEKDKDKRYRKRQFITKNSGPAIRDIVELVTKSKRPHERTKFFSRIRAEKRVAIAMRSCILKLADCAKNTETFYVFTGEKLKSKLEVVRREYLLLAEKAHRCIKKLSTTDEKKEFLHKVTDKLYEMIQKNISKYK
jgi:hypothetical protein